MGLFDSIQGNLDTIAGKVGMSPDQVKQITGTLTTQLEQTGGSHVAALEATAAQHGVPVDQLQALLAHSGMADQIEQYAKGFFKT